MYRTHTCGELKLLDYSKPVTLCGWVHRIRDFGGMIFIDLRDRYGITQLVFNPELNQALAEQAKILGREFVISAHGKVTERSNKNKNIPTGDIEIAVESFEVLNPSKVPPFTIEDETDGGDDLRMKYRYLDLRRNPVQQNLLHRHKVARAVREYLDAKEFVDVETPHLIKSTPEGARDFVVPSRLNQGQFYALPQSPQTFKQLLMIAGFDRYYQIVRCFRDEDLRQDRQPEFTQIDCEMAFVQRDDVLDMFEGMVKSVFKSVRGIHLHDFPRMSYADAMRLYGNDKPDIRFGMEFIELNEQVKGNNFKVFDDTELVVGICATGCSEYTRKQLDELTEFVKRPQIGATGLVYIKCNTDGTFKSSVDKFYAPEKLKTIAESINAVAGDLILILAGNKNKTRKALSELRLEMGNRMGLRSKDVYKPLWVIDFPLLEWDEEEKQWNAMHHPFTSWNPDDEHLLDSSPGDIRANAYDVVINGVEIGGGSIRIHNRAKQEKMFSLLGLSKEEAENKFGFILNAFEYGAPPHGGIAFGFDRFCSMTISNQENIRDFIAFPKNNAGRDVMLDAPSAIDEKQLEELNLDYSLRWKIIESLNPTHDYPLGRRTLSGIAKEVNVTQKYVEKILNTLIKIGIVGQKDEYYFKYSKIIDIYNELGSKLSQLELIESLQTMWAYFIYNKYGKPLPNDIQYPYKLTKDSNEFEKMNYGIQDFEIEFLTTEILLHCNKNIKDLPTLKRFEFLGDVVNDLRKLDDTIAKTYIKKGDALFEFFRMSHRQFVWQENTTPQNIYRYYKIFTESTLDILVKQIFGLSVKDIQLIGFLFSGAFTRNFVVPPEFKSNIKSIPDEMIKMFLKHFSTDLETLKAQISSSRELNEKLFYSYDPLRKFPLINIDGNIYCPIPLFLNWQITSGLYYSLIESQKLDNNAFGKAFESYVGELIQEIDNPKKLDVYPERKYGNSEKKTVDWLISDADSFLFLECKTKRVKLSSKIEINPETGVDDDLKIMADNILKSYKTIIDFRNGKYPEIQYNSEKKIFLIILTLEEWYISFNPVLLNRLRDEIKNLLIENNIDKNIVEEVPYFIFSSNKFEYDFQVMRDFGIANYFTKYLNNTLIEQTKNFEYRNLFQSKFKEIFIDPFGEK